MVDPTGAWLLRLESVAELTRTEDGASSPVVAAMLSSMASRLPVLQLLLRESRHLRVAFSPHVTRGLVDGSLKLMQSGGSSLPVAVNHAGRVVSHSPVVGGTAAGAGVAGLAVIAWPVLLTTAVAVVASYAQQRWLEQTLGRLEAALGRIEDRLRDDDHGVLEASEQLCLLLRPSVYAGTVSDQMLMELALRRRDTDSTYYSRRRFVERFKRQLEQEQDKSQKGGKPGAKRAAWTGGIADYLTDKNTGMVDELVVFLRAMNCQAQLTTLTALVLASEQDGETALRMMQGLEEELRRDYHDLHNRMRALARVEPDAALWERVPVLSSTGLPVISPAEKKQAHALVRRIEQAMNETVGSSLPTRDSAPSMVIEGTAVEVPTSGG